MPRARGARGGALVLLTAVLAGAAGAQQPGPAKPVRHGDHDVWLSAPTVNGGPIRFPDELTPLADAVAELLARPAIGYRVLPNAELRALWRETQAGRLPGRRALCAAAPPPSRLARHLYRGASMADVDVDCALGAGKPCLLEVPIYSERPTTDDPDHLEETAHFRAELPAGETPAQWAERLRAAGLRRGAGHDRRGGLGVIGLEGDGKPRKSPPFWIEVSSVEQSAGCAEPISKATFARQAKQLEACTRGAPRWRDSWQQPYLLEVDGAGAVTRCEFSYLDHLPPPEHACVCGVLRGRGFGAGPPGRRASFVLDVKHPLPPARGTVAVVSARASDPSAVLSDGQLDEEALGACLGPVRSEVEEPALPVHFTVGAEGQVLGHAAQWPASFPAAARRCLDEVLGRARFDCPLTGAATVDLRLQVSVNP